ncbi:hypothetical protein GCM10009603_48970 [Nocardiopsis exhalans]
MREWLNRAQRGLSLAAVPLGRIRADFAIGDRGCFGFRDRSGPTTRALRRGSRGHRRTSPAGTPGGAARPVPPVKPEERGGFEPPRWLGGGTGAGVGPVTLAPFLA